MLPTFGVGKGRRGGKHRCPECRVRRKETDERAQTTARPSPGEKKTENRRRYPSGSSRYPHLALRYVPLPATSFFPGSFSALPSRLAPLPGLAPPWLTPSCTPPAPLPRRAAVPGGRPSTRRRGPGLRAGEPLRPSSLPSWLFPPRPLSPSTLPAVHLEYLGFLNGVSWIRSPRLPLAVG